MHSDLRVAIIIRSGLHTPDLPQFSLLNFQSKDQIALVTLKILMI